MSNKLAWMFAVACLALAPVACGGDDDDDNGGTGGTGGKGGTGGTAGTGGSSGSGGSGTGGADTGGTGGGGTGGSGTGGTAAGGAGGAAGGMGGAGGVGGGAPEPDAECVRWCTTQSAVIAQCEDQQGAAGASGAAGSAGVAGAAGAGGDDDAMAACVAGCEGALTLVPECEDEYRDYLRCGYYYEPTSWECAGEGEVYAPLYCDDYYNGRWVQCTQ